jgi:peptidylprolyl isomerase
MKLNNKDFILVDYTEKIKDTNKIVESTNKEIATKEHIFKEYKLYEPIVMILGEGKLKILEEELLKQEVELNKPITIEVLPKFAYGERIPNAMKTVPLKRFTSKGIMPIMGMQIDYNGKIARVHFIGSGRVVLDFNHPNAGKTILYEVNIIMKIESIEDKVKALVHRNIPIIEVEKFSIHIENNILTIDIPEDARYVEGLQVAKRNIVTDITKYIPDINEVRFIEISKIVKKESDK